jgi:hypothetical protein
MDFLALCRSHQVRPIEAVVHQAACRRSRCLFFLLLLLLLLRENKQELGLKLKVFLISQFFWGLPASRRPRGWYWKADLGKRLPSILSRWSNQLFLCNFIFSIRLVLFNQLRISGFLWRSNRLRSDNGLRNLICVPSSFEASLLFIIQFLLPYYKAELEVMLSTRNFTYRFISNIVDFLNLFSLNHINWQRCFVLSCFSVEGCAMIKGSY